MIAAVQCGLAATVMEKCDVLIVGGGPAGSSCAWGLRKSGLDVVILDKAVFPRHKVCGGWITPAVIDGLQIDLNDYRSTRVLQPITGFRTGCIGGPEVYTDYGQPVSYGIRRCEFDHYLLQRSGARLMPGRPLGTLRRALDRWIIDEQLQAQLIIGAGGNFCPVARQLTSRSCVDEAVVLAQEVEFQMTEGQAAACRIAGEVPELFFCEDLNGYGWCFRKDNFLNVGLGRVHEPRLAAHVERFCAFLKESGKIPDGLPTRLNGHAYRLYFSRGRTILQDRVLLIGDAAGLAYPQSGEGIRPAVESGLMAAAVIQAAAGDYQRDLSNDLQAMLSQRLGQRKSRPGLRGLLPASWTRFLSGRLLATQWFTRKILLDRWFLHRDEQPLRPYSDADQSDSAGTSRSCDLPAAR